MKRRLVLLSLVSLMFLGTACDDKVAGEKAADLLNTVDKVRLKLNLKDSEGLVISNQNVEIGMEIDSYATARDNYFGDLNYSELYYNNIAFYNKYDPHTGCNPYIGRRFKVDGYDLIVKYNTPPTVLYTTKINANTQVDSKGRINKTFFLSDGESTSSAFRDT